MNCKFEIEEKNDAISCNQTTYLGILIMIFQFAKKNLYNVKET